jgi:gamma-glutamylcyclotransferase (GGCT)/AIG2-like uncharacterized protein YtfP
MLYFAYGSNMNHAHMDKLCPGAKFVDAAALEAYKFTYEGSADPMYGAVANIAKRTKDDVVWGGLYEVTEEHLNALDDYEDCPAVYRRIEVNVITMEGDLVSAVTYCKEPEEPREPADEYRELVRSGAGDCGLPARYVKENL